MAEQRRRGQPGTPLNALRKITGLKKEIAQLKAIKARFDKGGVKIKPLGVKPGDTINASSVRANNNFLRTYKDKLSKLQRRLASLTGGSIGRTEVKDMKKSPAQSKEKYSKDDIDDAGPVGKEARRDKRDDNKNKTVNTKGKSDKEENKRTSMKDFKKKTISDGGPRPDNANKKKKKRTMMKGTNTNLSKNNYGLNRKTGNYLGQR